MANLVRLVERDLRYRFKQRREATRSERTDDRDLLPLAIVLWLVCVVRVVVAFTHHEVFGSEQTLATLVVVGMPLLFVHGRPRASSGPAAARPVAAAHPDPGAAASSRSAPVVRLRPGKSPGVQAPQARTLAQPRQDA